MAAARRAEKMSSEGQKSRSQHDYNKGNDHTFLVKYAAAAADVGLHVNTTARVSSFVNFVYLLCVRWVADFECNAISCVVSQVITRMQA